MILGQRTKIDSKARVMLPESVRQMFDITTGDALHWIDVSTEGDDLIFRVRVSRQGTPPNSERTENADETRKRVNPIVEILERLERVEAHLRYIKPSKEDIVSRIKKIVDEKGYIAWSMVTKDELLFTMIKTRAKYERIMLNLAPSLNLKTELLGNKRIFYRDGFDVDKLKSKLALRQLRADDAEIMKMIKRHCEESGESKINIDTFLHENFPQFAENEYNEIRWKFMKLCEQNKDWGIVPLRIGHKYTDIVEKKAKISAGMVR